MPKPSKYSPRTPFAERVAKALSTAGLDQSQAAHKLSEMVGRTIKPQTVQYMTSKAGSSELTAEVALLTGYSYAWLARGEGPEGSSWDDHQFVVQAVMQKRALADFKAPAVYEAYPTSSGSFNEAENASIEEQSVSRLALQKSARKSRRESYPVPRLDTLASMGNGMAIRDVVEVIDVVHLNIPELCKARGVTITAPENLRIVTGYGGSMRPTFDHLDPLLVDVGITDLKVDDVYCLEHADELFIKRVQRVPGKKDAYRIISDNKQFESFEVLDPLRDGFKVLARVVLAINLNKV